MSISMLTQDEFQLVIKELNELNRRNELKHILDKFEAKRRNSRGVSMELIDFNISPLKFIQNAHAAAMLFDQLIQENPDKYFGIQILYYENALVIRSAS